MPVKIYQQERQDGLADLISSSAHLSYASTIEVVDKFEIPERSQKKIERAVATNGGQFDLFYLKSILASVGWNKNDDIFEAEETLAAYRTPEDKPVNHEHNQADIIGHMTDCWLVGEDGKPFSDDGEIPSKFHVATSAVLYKYWTDAEKQERMDQIIEEIESGEWAVSMECLFPAFDYAIKDDKGKTLIIARNSETAFLTKHLRAYGGKGVYQGKKLGRVLRNFAFSGKGLTRKPANEDSIIDLDMEELFLGKSEIFIPVEENLGYSKSNEDISQAIAEENTVPDNTIEKELSKAQEKIVELEKQLSSVDVAKANEAVAEANKTIADLNETIESLKTDVAARDESVANITKELESLKETSETEREAHKTVAEELEGIKAEQTKANRIALVVEKLKAEKAEAEELVEGFASLADEAFESQIEFMAKTVAKFTPAPTPPKATNKPAPPKATNKPAPMSGQASEDDANGEQAADSVDLDEAKANEDADLNVTDDSVVSVQKAVASYFGVVEDE